MKIGKSMPSFVLRTPASFDKKPASNASASTSWDTSPKRCSFSPPEPNHSNSHLRLGPHRHHYEHQPPSAISSQGHDLASNGRRMSLPLHPAPPPPPPFGKAASDPSVGGAAASLMRIRTSFSVDSVGQVRPGSSSTQPSIQLQPWRKEKAPTKSTRTPAGSKSPHGDDHNQDQQSNIVPAPDTRDQPKPKARCQRKRKSPLGDEEPAEYVSPVLETTPTPLASPERARSRTQTQTDPTTITRTAPSESKLDFLGKSIEEAPPTPPAQPDPEPELKIEIHEVLSAELQAKFAMMHARAKLEAENSWVSYEFGDSAGATTAGGVGGAGAGVGAMGTPVGVVGGGVTITPGAQAV
ncbi:hypothetical protein AAF712_011065 [Marasmius tenuissimus]|uniref:Uncharacterized protein n=1 Tax=Marasmius tenuissimus TaxID=585030 RepID=A0ABR2ZL79_9AGAR